MNTTNAIATIDVDGVRVVFHCEHDDGSSTYRIEHDNEHVTVYLQGTPEQLGAMADAIMRACSRRAIQEVERANREANLRTESPFWLRITGACRWCFVCREWIDEWQTHAHAERIDPWHPANTAELAQRDRETFRHRIVTP